MTSDDVLCAMGAEEEVKQSRLAKKKGAPKTKKKKDGSLDSDSAPSTPLSSSLPAPTPTPSSPSPSGTVGETEIGDEATSTSFEGEEGALEPSSEPDPYDTRVGEFRMMTFFAIKDIPQGKKAHSCHVAMLQFTSCVLHAISKEEEKKANHYWCFLGQDITISYIDAEMPLQARRLALLTDYHFHCCCERCMREETASAPGSNKKGLKEKDNKKKGGGGGGGGKKGRK